jgi:hypothetical protein
MSKKRSGQKAGSVLSVADERRSDSPQAFESETNWWTGLSLNGRWLVVGVIAFLSIGALGAGLKYLEEDARRMESGKRTMENREQSFLDSVNPFITAPPPPPTPQLSKELIYAGQKLVVVEDANSNAAPPADLAIWRPTTGQWWVMGGPGSSQTIQGWGTNGDIPVPGDYDGDGKTDFSIFRPSNSQWYIVYSGSNTFPPPFAFGVSGDKPAQADYDGDGRTDAAVFRPSNNNWYVLGTTNGFYYSTWGETNDVPVSADYDGDGRADIAVWRGSNKTFYSVNSSNGNWQVIPFSQSSTQPVCGDYDGDGKADFAIRSGANWIIRNSATPATPVTIPWQLATDTPVPNDYDGDGKCDIAVWRPANSPAQTDAGNWFIRQSATNTLRQQAWGQPGDIPVPAFYRR